MPYLEIEGEARSDLLISRSRFLGLLRAVQTETDALAALEEARRAHREATHHCFAYLIGPERGIQRHSDDREPQGTAGIPILETLKTARLTNVLMVCTRYFGGVLLGAGGLARAYAACTDVAVKAARIVSAQIMDAYRLDVSYPVWARLETLFRQAGVRVLETAYGETVGIRAVEPKNAGLVAQAAAEASCGGAACAYEGEIVIKTPVDRS